MQPRGLLDSATSSALGPASCARGSPTGHLNHHGMLLMERARPGIRVRSATQHHVCNPASDNQTHHLPLPADASALFKFPESSALGSASRPARGPASSPSARHQAQAPRSSGKSQRRGPASYACSTRPTFMLCFPSIIRGPAASSGRAPHWHALLRITDAGRPNMHCRGVRPCFKYDRPGIKSARHGIERERYHDQA